MQATRILAIDDHPLFAEGIAAILDLHADLHLVGVARTGRQGIEQYREHRPDLALLDVRLPDMDGVDVLIGLHAEFPEARVVMLSTFYGDVDVQRALSAGAWGFLVKSMPPDEIIGAVRRVVAGKKCIPPVVAVALAEHVTDDKLTSREIEILQLIADGNRNREIGDRLKITEDTVKVHVKHLLNKLDARDRTQAVVIGLKRGLLRL